MSTTKNKLQQCKKYIDKGLIPIPVNYRKVAYFKEGKLIEKSEKAPLLPKWQNTSIQNSYKIIQQKLNKNFNYNIGILTGEASNIIVVDIDLPKNNKEKDGMQKINELQKKYSKINTLTARTPSGGLHFVFKYNDDAKLLKGSTKIGGYSIDIRSNNNQIVVYPSKYDKGQYKWINNNDITDMPQWLFEFLVDNTNDKNLQNYREKYNKKNKKYVRTSCKKINNNNNNDVFYTVENEQIEQVRYILDKLPHKFYDEYILWRNIGFALSMTSREKLEPLFKDFSKKSEKYSDNEFNTLWNTIKNDKQNNIKINSLIYWFKCYNREDKTKFSFPLAKKYDPIVKYKNNKKITTIFDEIPLLTNKPNIINEIKKHKIIFMKSPTGTGKTQLYNKFLKNIYDDKFLSIVSRTSIATKQVYDFNKIGINVSIYSDQDFTQENMICQLDSIHKLEPELYIDAPLFLDEFNSICSYLTSSTLNGKRKEILEIFTDIILNARTIYCADADMSDMAIDFMFDIYKTHNLEIPSTLLYWNRIQNVNNKATFYKNLLTLETEILKSIENNIPFIVACDSKCKLDILVEKCKMHCNDNNIEERIDNFLVYSKDEGDTEDFENINNKWQDKFIFFTPKIVYGLSFECKETNVFGIFYNKSINPLNMMQQLSRCRRIKELKIYINNNTYPIKYNYVEDVKKYNLDMYDIHNKFINREKIINDKLDKCYENLFAYHEYYNDILFSYPKYQLQEILKEKSFTIVNNNDENIIDDKYNKKIIEDNIKNNKDKDLKKIFESFCIKDMILTTPQKNKKIKMLDKLSFLKISTDQAMKNQNIIDILTNDIKYKQHLTICEAFLDDNIAENNYKHFESTEFKELTWNSTHSKLKIMRYMENYLKINPFDIDNLDPVSLEDSIIDNFDKNIIIQIAALFRYKNIVINTHHDIYRYLIKIYQSIFGNEIVKNINKKHYKTKRIHTYNIDKELLLKNFYIFKHRILDINIIKNTIIKLLDVNINKCLFY